MAGPALSFEALEFTSLHYVVAGSGHLTLKDKTDIELSPGSIVIMPSGISYQLRGEGEEDKNLAIAKNCLPLDLGLQELGSAEGSGGMFSPAVR
eukprot:UN16057